MHDDRHQAEGGIGSLTRALRHGGIHHSLYTAQQDATQRIRLDICSASAQHRVSQELFEVMTLAVMTELWSYVRSKTSRVLMLSSGQSVTLGPRFEVTGLHGTIINDAGAQPD